MFAKVDTNGLTFAKIKEECQTFYKTGWEVFKKPDLLLNETLDKQPPESFTLVFATTFLFWLVLQMIGAGFYALFMLPLMTAAWILLVSGLSFALNHFFAKEKVTFLRAIHLTLYNFLLLLPLTIAGSVLGLIPFLGIILSFPLGILALCASVYLHYMGLRYVMKLSDKVIFLTYGAIFGVFFITLLVFIATGAALFLGLTR